MYQFAFSPKSLNNSSQIPAVEILNVASCSQNAERIYVLYDKKFQARNIKRALYFFIFLYIYILLYRSLFTVYSIFPQQQFLITINWHNTSSIKDFCSWFKRIGHTYVHRYISLKCSVVAKENKAKYVNKCVVQLACHWSTFLFLARFYKMNIILFY